MPFHRAYFRTATEAREAASAAIEKLRIAARATATAAGSQSGDARPVARFTIEAVDAIPATALPADKAVSNVRLSVLAPDGRVETAIATMPSAQATGMTSRAAGSVLLTSTNRTKVVARARIAKTVQAFTMQSSGSVTLTDLVLQDPSTGKKYKCGVYAALAAGTHTVPVVEEDTADLSDVTHGTPLEFLAPPMALSPIARVNALEGFTGAGADVLRSKTTKKLYTPVGAFLASSVTSLTGDLTVAFEVTRDVSDGLDLASAAEGEELEWVGTAPAGAASTVTVSSVGALAIPKGAILTGSGGRSYETTQDAEIGDALGAYANVIARADGPSQNLTVGEVLTLSSPPPGAGAVVVQTAIAAATYPEAYPAQLIGGARDWAAQVHPAPDGRWIADVYTVPIGS